MIGLFASPFSLDQVWLSWLQQAVLQLGAVPALLELFHKMLCIHWHWLKSLQIPTIFAQGTDTTPAHATLGEGQPLLGDATAWASSVNVLIHVGHVMSIPFWEAVFSAPLGHSNESPEAIASGQDFVAVLGSEMME